MAAESNVQRLTRPAERFFGKYRGQVKDNQDPSGRGRLFILVPQVLEDSPAWALPCVPFAGKNQGIYMMPDVGTGIWVEFEAGDPSFPIWTGCFWNAGDIPAADAAPTTKFIRTKKFTLRIDDTVGEISIENEAGSQVLLTAIEALVKSSTVKTEATGGRKTELSATGFSVNDGGLEVL